MISPWTIYWIMQLDSIRSFTSTAFVISAAAFAFLQFARGPVWAEGSSEGMRLINKWSIPAAALVALLGLVTALIPTTKTAAAMVLIPAIANNEAVQKEAGELYQLAKDGLRELVKPEEKK